jgi:hypothetical protein
MASNGLPNFNIESTLEERAYDTGFEGQGEPLSLSISARLGAAIEKVSWC